MGVEMMAVDNGELDLKWNLANPFVEIIGQKEDG